MTAIRHDAAHQRFSLDVDAVVGYLDYELAHDVMTITHTIVPPAIGGRGIAGQLVQAAVDHARAKGLRIVPRCSYADAWMRRHPQYQGLLA